MKKRFFTLLIAILMLFGTCTSFADDRITIKVDGEEITFYNAPQIIEGRTLVQELEFLYGIEAYVEYQNLNFPWGVENILHIEKNDKTIRITDGTNVMNVYDSSGSEEVVLDFVPPYGFLPVRAVSEALGYKVDWNGETREVIITSQN